MLILYRYIEAHGDTREQKCGRNCDALLPIKDIYILNSVANAFLLPLACNSWTSRTTISPCGITLVK
jgi:hypothetical protein